MRLFFQMAPWNGEGAEWGCMLSLVSIVIFPDAWGEPKPAKRLLLYEKTPR